MVCKVAQAQDDPQFTQYMFNPLQYNPAAAGNEQAIVSTLGARNQWAGLTGAPQSQSLTVHMPIYKLSSGIGLGILNDAAGQQKTTGITASYTLRKNFKESYIGFGIYGGIIQRSLDGSKLTTPGGSYQDGNIDHNDDLLPVTLENDLLPDAGAGIYFQSKRLYAGISAMHLLGNYYSFAAPEAIASIQSNPVVYATAGYKISLGTDFLITPSVLYKTDLVQSMADVNIIFAYKDNIFAGPSFRSYLNEQTDAVALIGGWNISDKLGVSYSYDITLSDLKTVSAGSHEIVLRYKIFVEKPRAGKEINNPRYLYY
jgi:type IX secretion system PorP/SprF family membrane protein